MTTKDNTNTEDFFQKAYKNKLVKVGVYAIATIATIYFIGKLARASSYAVDGIKDLKNSFK